MSLTRSTCANTGSAIDEERITSRSLFASCGSCSWNHRLGERAMFADAEQVLVEHYEQVHATVPVFVWSVNGQCPACEGEGYIVIGARHRERCASCEGLGRLVATS